MWCPFEAECTLRFSASQPRVNLRYWQFRVLPRGFTNPLEKPRLRGVCARECQPATGPFRKGFNVHAVTKR
ncbi:hypothetical protein SAMN05421809_2651 [Natronorubrum daqingense]|uniref:Uncharacterized protein n=1 Tax=Natronorubrum daqingense TaxID=588898 RepID=A0A1N7EK77_9EURY|nr:hypothetical protein SAMN05421809_2651 [Natronorubrum daqingense]